jgi:hypothetical protein
MKPETKEKVLQDRPQTDPADIEEYERLLSERFTIDPDLPRAPQAEAADQAREDRLAELYQKLFGS